MNKKELIEALSKELNLPQISTSALVETILDSMTKALVTGDNIEIRGFGSFTVRQYESYTGRNPKTGTEVEVKAKKLPFFKVGKDLKEAIMLGENKCPHKTSIQKE
jgi:integration host factor subunit beta